MSRNQSRAKKNCLSCGEAFDVHAYRVDAAKYCSRECYREHRFRKEGECPTCGAAPPRGQRFCSKECWRGHWQRREGERYEKRRLSYWKRKLAIVAELGGKCLKCGNDDPRVLDIDHIDPEKKNRPAHRKYPMGIRVVLWRGEMGNLQLLCANCHRIKTHAEHWRTGHILSG